MELAIFANDGLVNFFSDDYSNALAPADDIYDEDDNRFVLF
jgi:hypothetical protein